MPTAQPTPANSAHVDANQQFSIIGVAGTLGTADVKGTSPTVPIGANPVTGAMYVESTIAAGGGGTIVQSKVMDGVGTALGTVDGQGRLHVKVANEDDGSVVGRVYITDGNNSNRVNVDSGSSMYTNNIARTLNLLGTITGTGQTVFAGQDASGYTSARFVIAGTWSGNIQSKLSMDAGTYYVANFMDAQDPNNYSHDFGDSRVWYGPIQARYLQFTSTSWNSGTAYVELQLSSDGNFAVIGKNAQIKDSNGNNLAAIGSSLAVTPIGGTTVLAPFYTLGQVPFGTLGTTGASVFGTLAGGTSSGAGTQIFVTSISLSIPSTAGSQDVSIGFGTNGGTFHSGTGRLVRGNFPAGGGITKFFSPPVNSGTNAQLTYFQAGAGTVNVDVTSFTTASTL